MATTDVTGVLVIAHGSRNPTWNQLVEEAVKGVETDLPITVGYLELVEGRLIPDGVQWLEAQGVNRILAVPLFVSSGSTHLEEIQYALGVKSRSRVETHLSPIRPQAEIVWCPAMDAHPLILRLLKERVCKLSHSPGEESLLLVAHGSGQSGFQAVWDRGLRQLTDGLQKRFGFPEVEVAMLQLGNLREKAKVLCRGRRLLILPVFLSRGYFTDVVIPTELEGIPCAYREETYLPHPLVSRWIEETVNRWAR